MTAQEPSAPGASGTRGRVWLHAVLPHVLTAVVAIAISTFVQLTLNRQTYPVSPTIVPMTAVPTIKPTEAPEPSPVGPPLAEGVTRQELLDLHAEDNRIWAAIYLARAISEVSNAETELQSNDLESVEQTLVAIDESLALAYERSSESSRNPIDELRRGLGTIREDLYLRPEAMDVRLAQLRQTILALIEERR